VHNTAHIINSMRLDNVAGEGRGNRQREDRQNELLTLAHNNWPSLGILMVKRPREARARSVPACCQRSVIARARRRASTDKGMSSPCSSTSPGQLASYAAYHSSHAARHTTLEARSDQDDNGQRFPTSSPGFPEFFPQTRCDGLRLVTSDCG
jgi:hypothetical protein